MLVQMLLLASVLFVGAFATLIISMENKKQIHYAVLALSASVFFWNLVVLLHLVLQETGWSAFFEHLYFLGPVCVSVAILFVGYIFSHNRMSLSKRVGLIFVPPLVSVLALVTNPLHKLFFTTFSYVPSLQDFGIFFVWHSLVSYLYIAVGLFFLIDFSIKNYGFYSRQSLLILLGVSVSFVFDSFSTLKIYDWPAYFENILFTFSFACFMLAIIRYDFLNILPIAYKTIVDSVTDGYVVINDDYEIVDYNKAFDEMFSRLIRFRRKDNVLRVLEEYQSSTYSGSLLAELIEKSIEEKKTVETEVTMSFGGKTYFHKLDIIPILKKQHYIGTTIIIRDITESIDHLQQITALNNQLQELAIRDGLTKAYNRYFFDERLQQAIAGVLRDQEYRNKPMNEIESFGLIIFDIDSFKNYNDINGHLAGDELLRQLVGLVQKQLFSTDILCRYGGEEFAIICCQTQKEGIIKVAEKIRAAVEAHSFASEAGQPGGRITISVGATYFSDISMSKDALIKRADENLYRAKESGKNTVVFE